MGGGLSSCGNGGPAPVVPKTSHDDASFSEDVVTPLNGHLLGTRSNHSTTQSTSSSGHVATRKLSHSLGSSVASQFHPGMGTTHPPNSIVAYSDRPASTHPSSGVIEKKNPLFRKAGPGGQIPRYDAASQTDKLHHEYSRDFGPQMPTRWKKGESIGSGSFGTVFLGLNSDTGGVGCAGAGAEAAGPPRGGGFRG